MNYRYHLLKYDGPTSRLTCPACGRKHSFSPYVDSNNQIVGEEYGRCDYESSCGYVKYPPSISNLRLSWPENHNHRTISGEQAMHNLTDDICTIPLDIVKKTVKTIPLSDFLRFLCKLFDVKTIKNLIVEYLLGVTDSGDVIFYHIDMQNRCRTGKILKYDRDTGHLVKDESSPNKITWVHYMLKQQGVLPQEWVLSQCWFGEHLLRKYPNKPVCLVEDEKTALICAALVPNYIWVAVGGNGQLGDMVEVLYGRTVVAFPDSDTYDKWEEVINECPYLNIQIYDFLNEYATPEELDSGADISDVLVRCILEQKIISFHETYGEPPD